MIVRHIGPSSDALFDPPEKRLHSTPPLPTLRQSGADGATAVDKPATAACHRVTVQRDDIQLGVTRYDFATRHVGHLSPFAAERRAPVVERQRSTSRWAPRHDVPDLEVERQKSSA